MSELLVLSEVSPLLRSSCFFVSSGSRYFELGPVSLNSDGMPLRALGRKGPKNGHFANKNRLLLGNYPDRENGMSNFYSSDKSLVKS